MASCCGWRWRTTLHKSSPNSDGKIQFASAGTARLPAPHSNAKRSTFLSVSISPTYTCFGRDIGSGRKILRRPSIGGFVELAIGETDPTGAFRRGQYVGRHISDRSASKSQSHSVRSPAEAPHTSTSTPHSPPAIVAFQCADWANMRRSARRPLPGYQLSPYGRSSTLNDQPLRFCCVRCHASSAMAPGLMKKSSGLSLKRSRVHGTSITASIIM
jgi:hypothetical protein